MTMTPEEIVNSEIWDILKDVKEEGLVPEEDGSFFYDTSRTVIAPGQPSPTGERKWSIVRKLAREKAVEIVREIEPDWGASRNGFYLRLLQPKFDEVYEKYHRINVPQEDFQAVPSHEYLLTNSDLVDSLQRQINNFVNLPEKGFFLGIADYVKFVDENSRFEKIIATIDNFRNRDKAKLTELEGEVINDVDTAEKIVMEKIGHKKIEPKEIKRRIEEYEMIKDGRIQSSASKADALHDGLCHLIMSLHEGGYGSLVSEFIKLVPNSKSIADYQISKHYYPYREEARDYKSKVQKTIWGSWNELIVAYLVVHGYRERMKELTDSNDVIGQMNFHMLHEEMENVLGNATSEPRRLQFSKDDYTIHINRVHDFIINKLKSEPNRKVEQEAYNPIVRDLSPKMPMRPAWEELNDGGRNENLMKEIKAQKGSPAVNQVSTPKLGAYKLQYSPDNGFAHFNGTEHIFTGKKERAFLSVLNGNKNTPYSIEGIKEKCNPLIPDSEYYFKDRKDIDDTLLRIKKALKVNKGEYSPIQKREKNWIWIDK